MGCCFSRMDSKIVKLCKERKELIEDARDSQCSLAFAHMAYFQSLQDAEREFSNFMNEALVSYHDSPFDTIADHLKEQFPQSENSSSGNSDEAKDEEVDEDDVNSKTFCVIGGSNLSKFQSKEAINSKTCFDGVPDNVLHQSQVAATKKPEHLKIRSFKGVTAQPWYGKFVASSNPDSLRFAQSESAGLRPLGNLGFPPFNKKWRKLKKLDDQGAESEKIEARQLSLRKLTSRINLFISKVDRIAKRIHELRDEELVVSPLFPGPMEAAGIG